MFLIGIVKTDPLSAFAILITLGTIFWCLRMIRLQRTRLDRFLMGLLGLIATYQGLRLLRDAGFWSRVSPHPLRSLADVTVSILYLIATLILHLSGADRMNTRMQLRVVEADHRLPNLLKLMPEPVEPSPVGLFGVGPGGEVRLWHFSAERLLGWKADEVMGTHLPFGGKLLANNHEPLLYPRLQLRSKSGQTIEVAVWTMPLTSENAISFVLAMPPALLAAATAGAAPDLAALAAAAQPELKPATQC
jgi:PAS domain-containing protein